MWLLRGLLDRLVLLASVLCAGCIPGFIIQYRQRLNGRLDQVLLDLAPFQAIADSEHHASLQELVQYHLQSTDPTFHHEGEALQSMMRAADQLRAMAQALNVDVAHQFAYLLTHADRGLLHATWTDYRPAFALDADGVIFALIVGVGVWSVFMLLLLAFGWLLRTLWGERWERTG
ncbi:MAG TPA: DUF2937 family protein [Steroidobacteraceae bacterium]|nr:DUF2937 family protein [Steroidobacteraceae bacterium]